MARIKKILCLALTVALVSSLVAMPASAAANWSHSFDMSAMMGSGDYGRHGTTTTTDYNVTGIYGKGSDGVLKLNAVEGNADYYLGLSGSSSRYTFSANSKTVISYDIAFDSLSASGNNHVSLLQFANSSGGQLAQLNLVQITANGAVNPLDKGNIATPVKIGRWNNITAVIDLGADSKAYTCTIYLNGVSVQSTTGNLSAEASYVRAIRICDRTVGGNVYVDNLLFASYPSTDTVNLAFTTEAASTEEGLIDTANKAISLSDIAMTVASFNEKTTGFVVLDENGEVASGDTLIVNANVYAVYTSGINSYYEPYTLSIEPPSISGNTTLDREFIDTDNNEIRIVDIPDITVAEFKEMVSVSDGAVLSITKGGSDAADTDLLADCSVKAVLYAGDVAIKEAEYEVVTERSYTLANETFGNGTFTTRTSGNGYEAYSNNDVRWLANTNGKSGITFSEGSGIGGKADSDKSLKITVENASAAGDVFAYISNPYVSSSKVSNVTHTMEAKLLIDGADASDINYVDLVFNGRVALQFFPDGSIKTTDGTVLTDLTWKNGEWIPIAVTYHKATNRINVYACGVDTNCSWTPAPNGTDIRFRAILKEGASFTYAIDDVKLYTDSLEKVRYEVDGVNSTVTMYATDKIPCLPILAVYKNNALSEFVLGKESRTISVDYENGDKVKAMLWKGGSNLKPIADAKTLVDGGAPLTAYDAALSKAFSDGMVLQSGMPITVWGTSGDPDTSTLSVTLGNETKIAYVNGGEWEAAFSAREASAEGETLTVTTANGTQTVNDIVFGDVYFVGGQSNAYLPMKRTNTYAADKSSFTETDNIRFFHQTGDTKSTVQQNPVSGSTWTIASGSNIANMSAIGMYFAKTLVENNVNVPIGLISIAHNGTSLYAHLPANIVSKYNELGAINNANRGPSMVYNAMIAPVEKFSAKGLLWYQGENDSLKNVVDATTLYYGSMFDDFTDHLKTTTGNNDFKVFAVQLSSHGTDAYPDDAGVGNQTTGWQVARFRAYQYDTLKNKANSYIVPSLDHGWRIGDGASDVAASNGALTITEFVSHPEYKKPIGQRLANAALYSIYNKKTADEALAPMPESITYSGNTVTIKFKNVGTGLGLADGSTLLGFELIEENTAVSAEAEIQGTDTVVITSDEITAATGVRYAFYHSAPNTVANLVNSYGMPSLTFADDKDGVAAGTAMKTEQISWGAVLENE